MVLIMKIAMCYYGLSYNLDNIKESNAPSLPVNFYSSVNMHKKVLWEPNDMDIFIHTWSYEKKRDIELLYNPIASIFEPQIDFTTVANSINTPIESDPSNQKKHIISRWYSTQQSIKLKSNYEIENNFKYDLVMISRFDCKYSGEWNLSKLNPELFYISGGWPGNYDIEYPDLWFISNSYNIDKLGTLYDKLETTFNTNVHDNLQSFWGGHLLIRRHLGNENLLDKITKYKNHYIDSDIIRG